MSIFIQAEAVAEMLTERLPLLGAALSVMPGPASIWRRIQAAEAEVSGNLNIDLEPFEIFGSEPTAAELAALGDAKYKVDEAYDLPANFFRPGVWGCLQLRNRPLLSVAGIRIAHAALPGSSMDIPQNWLTFDRKAALVSILPGVASGPMQLSLVMLSSLFSSGTSIPAILHVRYRAGLESNSPYIHAIQDLVLRLATAKVLSAAMVPQSQSLSADGISQSQSQDVSKHFDSIKAETEDLRQQLYGPVYGVV